jgi:glycosyltransferase involved in cell wall biosynthesis
VHPDYYVAQADSQAAGLPAEIELPDTYVLYHGPGDPDSLYRLMLAWRWAAAHIGAYHPLLVLGLDRAAQAQLQGLLDQSNFADTVQIMPSTTAEMIAHLYQGCTALFHPAPLSPWGGAVRRALACGKPVAAAEGDLTSTLVGPAAYLAPIDDPRALGAALITVVVEEEVAEYLSKAACQRASEWKLESFGERLGVLYEGLRSRV